MVVSLGKRVDTSNKGALPIDYGRRPLVRLSDDATVHVVTDGEQVRDKVIRLVRRFDTSNKRLCRLTKNVVHTYAWSTTREYTL